MGLTPRTNIETSNRNLRSTVRVFGGPNRDAWRASHLSKTQPKPRPGEPSQAVTGSRSRCFRNRLLKPPPEPLSRSACAVVRARLGLLATASGNGGVFARPRSCGLGSLIGIGWKGARIPAYLAKHLCGFDAAERLWRSRESKIYRRYPSELHLASTLKSVMVIAIWLPKKMAYQRVLISH